MCAVNSAERHGKTQHQKLAYHGNLWEQRLEKWQRFVACVAHDLAHPLPRDTRPETTTPRTSILGTFLPVRSENPACCRWNRCFLSRLRVFLWKPRFRGSVPNVGGPCSKLTSSGRMATVSATAPVFDEIERMLDRTRWDVFWSAAQ
jgi:hypothetical protein